MRDVGRRSKLFPPSWLVRICCVDCKLSAHNWLPGPAREGKRNDAEAAVAGADLDPTSSTHQTGHFPNDRLAMNCLMQNSL
jgi:hypothetical protein